MGTINLHCSLLPQYKGPSPINWVIINGEKITGLTIFFINDKVDSGNIILQKQIEILNNETAGQLQEKFKKVGGCILLKAVKYLINNRLYLIPNKKINYSLLKYAPKIFSKDCKIKWSCSLKSIYNKIRGLSPIPTAWTYLFFNKKNIVRFKIFLSEKKEINHDFTIGLVKITKNSMKIFVKNGFLKIIECQVAGKKKMNVKDFINGIKIRKNIFVK